VKLTRQVKGAAETSVHDVEKIIEKGDSQRIQSCRTETGFRPQDLVSHQVIFHGLVNPQTPAGAWREFGD